VGWQGGDSLDVQLLFRCRYLNLRKLGRLAWRKLSCKESRALSSIVMVECQ
jgi:hypothetical protein